MSEHLTTVDGLFGQKIHYDSNGNYAGESWPGLFSGSYEHYDASGQYAGYSDPGLFADLVHHGPTGQYLGETWQGALPGHHIHYGTDGVAGDSWDMPFTTETDLFDF